MVSLSLRCCQRSAGGAALVTFVVGVFAWLSALYGIYWSDSIYHSEQPSGSQQGASQTGDDFPLIRGVNLGGWLVLEPWIVPSLFYQFQGLDPPAVDEKTFCQVLGTDEAKRQLEYFRDTWVTEDTFKTLKEAGLNAVRIPYGYWSWGDQPDFCHGISSIHYLDKAVDWAEQYGLRVLLDLHGVKGSQNGFDNSGESFRVPWSASWHNKEPWDANNWLLEENAAIARAVLAKTTARYKDREHVTMFGLVNEPNGYYTFSPECKSGTCPLSQNKLLDFYTQAYHETRKAIGPQMTERASPVMDVSFRPTSWEMLRPGGTDAGNAWSNAGRWGAMMDTHRYFGFDWYQLFVPDFLAGWYQMLVPQVVLLRTAACDWHKELEFQHEKQLPTIVGEWSLAPTDCMTWLNGYGLASLRNPQSTCDYVECPETYGKLKTDHLAGLEGKGAPPKHCPIDPRTAPRGKLSYHEFYKLLTRYLMRGHERSRGWFFWNFKCEVSDPRWCFLDAWERGWFPKDMSVDAYTPPTPNCDTRETLFGSVRNATSVALYCMRAFFALVVFCVCCCVAPCCCPSLRERNSVREITETLVTPGVELSDMKTAQDQ